MPVRPSTWNPDINLPFCLILWRCRSSHVMLLSFVMSAALSSLVSLEKLFYFCHMNCLVLKFTTTDVTNLSICSYHVRSRHSQTVENARLCFLVLPHLISSKSVWLLNTYSVLCRYFWLQQTFEGDNWHLPWPCLSEVFQTWYFSL